jgi:DNA-binding FrmR family transcriptional regulator
MSDDKNTCCHTTSGGALRPRYDAELPRLNRVAGQINGIKKMIEDGRYCPEILTQLKAARAALRTIEASILEEHLGACVADAILQGDQAEKDLKIMEIINLFKRYDD